MAARKGIWGVLMAFALVLAACGETATSPTAAPATDTPPDASPDPTAEPVAEKCNGEEVSFLLSFIPQAQHAGFLVAANRGYYEEEGVVVDIQPGGPGVSVIQAVGDGSVDIGQPDYAEVLLARTAGAPVVAFAQVYKDPFFFWYATKDTGIDSMEDWAGQRVGAIQIGEYPERDAMLLEAGVQPNEIEEVQQDFGVEEFMAGTVDIGEGVVFFHPASLELEEGYDWPEDFHIFEPAELGADVASQTLSTNETFLAENPDVLRCFLRASVRGWQDVLDDPDGAVDDVMSFIPEEAIPRVHQEIAIHDVLPIMGSRDDLLKLDPQALEDSVELLTDVGYLREEVDLASSFDTSIYDTMGPVEP